MEAGEGVGVQVQVETLPLEATSRDLIRAITMTGTSGAAARGRSS